MSVSQLRYSSVVGQESTPTQSLASAPNNRAWKMISRGRSGAVCRRSGSGREPQKADVSQRPNQGKTAALWISCLDIKVCEADGGFADEAGKGCSLVLPSPPLKLAGEDMTTPALGRIVIYTKKIDEMAEFYSRHFGFFVERSNGDRIVELKPRGPGLTILLHPAASKQKEGQVLVKLVFDAADVEAFCSTARANGLGFGKIHRADGYVFANAKDPSKNSIQVSSRAFAML